MPGSWECLPNAYVVTRASSIVIEANSSVKLAEMQSVAVEVAGGSYLIPATPELEYKWAAYDPESGILQLRPSTNLAAIECFYFVQHNSSAVTLEVLGGGVITAGNWWLQCTASARDGAAMAPSAHRRPPYSPPCAIQPPSLTPTILPAPTSPAPHPPPVPSNLHLLFPRTTFAERLVRGTGQRLDARVHPVGPPA